MSYNRDPNWNKLKPSIDWDKEEEKLADKFSKFLNNQIISKMKTDKIKFSKFVREWNGPSGTIYYYDLMMENGDKGQIGVKEKGSAKIAEGATITYTSTERVGPTGIKTDNFKLVQPMPAPSNNYNSNAAPYVRKESADVQNSISRSVALNNAVLFVKEQKGAKPGDVLDAAEIFLAWLKEEAQAPVVTNQTTNNEISNDEMPF